MDILEKIQTQGLIFDGAMGSILISKGITGGEAPEQWNLTHPDIIMGIHQAYYDAGSDVVSANTYGASAIKLKKMGVSQSVEIVNRAGVQIARKVCGKGRYIAGELGLLGDMLAPMGPVSFDQAVDCFAQQAGFLEDEGVDAFLIETIFDINIAIAAIKAVRSVSEKPIFCSLTFKKMKRGFFTIFGNSPTDSMKSLVDAGASAVGANCSIGSRTMIDLADEIRKSIDVPVIIMPNAGMPKVTKDNTVFYPEDETFFANNIKKIKELGVEIVGGCCGTTPEYIKKIKEII
ncbi:MAG: homocysteine S-methyltransferase family protein [Proteobacteria bacterium]|nr:homocysteine S-methyltransferase family protein [Pseudomonadota bacterium]MBU1582152.1 homocysteine S-methyltransferase family protein [Pseudomonadota bacterium]MBU2452475.1 homocysteine S-methyltransferase family protein [Pseudomonadota bacterium]MBU2629798.1 homocysteine S-methyltransferase family protein [Pseudomonadota bacterium]